MKASNYNIIINTKNDNETIIYNTLYGSLTVFDRFEIEEAKQILTNPSHYKKTKIKDILVKQKYLINKDIDEIEIISVRKNKGINDNNRLDVIIMPTLECNFSCIYCYETRVKGHMQENTIQKIKRWMTNEFPKHKFIMLHWYGGEPLLGFSAIVELTQYANEITKKHNILLVKHITTNGYGFSFNRIKKLMNLGINDYQITIDGTKEYHNLLRPLHNKKGTFTKVFNNVINILKYNSKAKITIRINFNKTNLHSIPELLDKFPIKYRNRLRVSYEPIFGSCSINAIDNISSDEMSQSIAKYYNLANEKGYDVTIGNSNIQTGKLVYCFAERKNQLIINFNGDIFKCSVSDFLPKDRLGYISNEGRLITNDRWKKWINFPLFDEICYSCKYLPLCMGGCRKSRIENKTTGSNCSLVPTNASYILKQISFQGFEELVINKT